MTKTYDYSELLDDDEGDRVQTVVVCQGKPRCHRTQDEKEREGICNYCGLFTNYWNPDDIADKMRVLH